MRKADLHGADTRISILFVCKANQCRSPLAEAIARRQIADREVAAEIRSAGLEANPGQPVTDGTLMAGRKAGFDLSEHRSQLVDAELVSSSNLILAMERDQIIDLVNVHGADLRHTFTVPELASIARLRTNRRADGTLADWLNWVASKRAPIEVLFAPPMEIPDPTGKAMRHYRTTIDRLGADLSTVFEAVLGKAV